MRRLAVSALLLLLAGCGSQPLQQDGPGRQLDLSTIKDAVPKVEPCSKYGNPATYVVANRRYSVLESSHGYHRRGIASWYGSKFHGRLTSSREPYDMYKVTAAHRSLPLPSYVEITNLDNRRKIIAKVNDRGPFHDQRLIDLSYAAAAKLGILEEGTGRVEVRVLEHAGCGAKLEPVIPRVVPPSPPAPSVPVAAPSSLGQRFIQVGAYSSWENAWSMQRRVQKLVTETVKVARSPSTGTESLYLVRIGPLSTAQQLERVASALDAAGIHPYALRND